MYLLLNVVPIQCKSEVSWYLPICVNLVVMLEYLNEVLRMLLAHVFDSKIVNYQCEADWSPCVFPETWCYLALCVSCLV